MQSFTNTIENSLQSPVQETVESGSLTTTHIQTALPSAGYPSVDVIIPHFNGVEILDKCLAALERTTYPNFTITIVDNGTIDESLKLASEKYKRIRIIGAGKNLGYAGGCNFGFAKTRGKYVVFLNNDTEQAPDWLENLVSVAESDETIAAVQPKLLSIQARERGERVFDYAGGAGGMLDALCYPYALGRVFNQTETDDGRYDTATEIFWASGAAMLARRSAIDRVGGFDDDFFAHMEEIDLCWRFWIAGYKVYAAPKSVVYHYGGATLAAGNPRKIYLNHRNNLMMIVKNSSLLRLLYLLPIRVMLELASLAYYRKHGSEYTAYVVNALVWNVKNFFKTFAKRRAVQQLRRRRDRDIFKNAGGWVVLKKAIAG